MCDAASTWRASTCAMEPRSRSAAYSGLIAAPGAPKAWLTPSFSRTSTAAMQAFIIAIANLLGFGTDAIIGRRRHPRKTALAHLAYSTVEWRAMDRLQALRLFVRVVDLGSFSKAAADLGIGQPSATKQVAEMEKQLGARLLHRSTRGVTPTEIGALYYEKCKVIVHHVDDADSMATLLQSQVQGVLRISTSVAFGRRVLAP